MLTNIISIMTARLFPSVGFAWGVRIVGFMYMGLITVAIATLHTRLDHKPSPFHVKALFRPLSEAAPALTAVASFFFFLGVFVPYDFLVGYALQENMGHRFGLNLLSIANGTR
jgi:predicted MFS family arabinose efflux permease